jgi:PAS fold
MDTRAFPTLTDATDRSLEQFSPDHSEHRGWFRLRFDDDRWTWSPQVEQMHGYRPGTVAPSTLLVLSHVHPDDDRHVAAVLYDVRRTRRPIRLHHRIIDTHHHVHHVVMIGVPEYDSSGALVGLQGFYLDVTALSSTAGQDRGSHSPVEDRLRQIRASTRC